MLALTNARVLTPQGIVEGCAVLVDGGRVVQLCDRNAVPAHAKTRDLSGGILAPGFIDVQVNGGGGVLFNDAPTVESIAAIGRAHRRFGTTGFLPTLISDDLDAVARAIEAVGRAIAEGVPGVLGVHIEGPFINEVRRGVHDATKLRKLDENAFKILTSLKGGRTLVTLAPETTTPDMIRRLARAGVVVSAGHTDASYEIMREALAAGVTGFTHLFNAMSPLASRAPGVVGAALEHQTSWAGIIVDGHHVDPAVLRIALNCKPHNRFMLVTDAMPSVGTENASFILQGRTITVQDGVLRAPDGTLAGAHLDMARAVRNATELLGLKVEEALAMASLHPAQFLGLTDRGVIVAGGRADLVLVDDDFNVKETWLAGLSDDLSR